MTDHETNHDNIKHHIAGIFDRAASTYGQIGAQFFDYFGNFLVESAHITAGQRVLDVATGRGAVLFPAATAVGPTGQVVGIDLSSSMIELTRAVAVDQGKTNVELHHMDAETLRFPDASFDAVLCGFALFMMPQMDQALAEMRRVLRPTRRIAFSTWANVFGPEFDWLEPLQNQFMPTPQAPARTRGGAMPTFDTPEGLTTILADAGFMDVHIIPETARFTYADEETWWDSLWSHGIRGWLEALQQQQGEVAVQRFKEAAFAQLQAHRSPDGFPQISSVLFGLGSKSVQTS
ncbi:MAG: methyltransferase domain-containing protein [Chloroflexota bacterium]